MVECRGWYLYLNVCQQECVRTVVFHQVPQRGTGPICIIKSLNLGYTLGVSTIFGVFDLYEINITFLETKQYLLRALQT